MTYSAAGLHRTHEEALQRRNHGIKPAPIRTSCGDQTAACNSPESILPLGAPLRLQAS